jgi:hypothetical protein
MLGQILSIRSGISVRIIVPLYKQRIRPMMDYMCLVWRSAARSQDRQPDFLQSKCLRFATNANVYVGNRQIHDSEIPRFAGKIRAVVEAFDTKLANMWNLISSSWTVFVSMRADRIPQLTEELNRYSAALNYKAAKSALWVLSIWSANLTDFPWFSLDISQIPG